MAGFSRNPSAWQYAFKGMNTVEAPDALQAVQYPVAVNIRALPNHSITTRPGYEELFVVETAPEITDTCPITAGTTGSAYSYTFTVVGGTGPYTWAIIAGSLPAGLSLNASTGAITGTPTDFGTFPFTIQVTDAVDHFDSKSCSVSILPVTTCGAFDLDWTRNARIGIFLGPTQGEFFYIGADPDEPKRLLVMKSSQFGENGSWARCDDVFPTLTNDIASHDCHENNWVDDDLVYVATQEASTGRLAYHCFDLATSTWTLLNSQIISSADIPTSDGGCCGITVTSTGDIGVLYDTNREDVSSTLYRRSGYRYSSDGGVTWSAEIQLGGMGEAINFGPARPVSDSEGRVQCFMGNSDNTDFFGHYYVQTITASHSLGTFTMWAGGSALSQIQSQGRMGDYCTFESGGVTQIVFVGRMTVTGRYTIFASSDNMTAPYQPADVRDGVLGTTFNGLGGSTYEAEYPQVSARMLGTTIHFMLNAFSNSTPTWLYHKTLASPYAPAGLTPSGDADQAGPVYDTFIPGQEMAAQIATIGGVDYWIGLRNSGVGGYGLIFDMIPLADLPTSASYTIDDFIADCLA